jgi:hypothetical protein
MTDDLLAKELVEAVFQRLQKNVLGRVPESNESVEFQRLALRTLEELRDSLKHDPAWLEAALKDHRKRKQATNTS